MAFLAGGFIPSSGGYSDGIFVSRLGLACLPDFAVSKWSRGRPTGVALFPDPSAAALPRYKMRAQDSGVSPPGYVSWVSSTPDFSGTGYAGGTPTPVGPMVPSSAVVAEMFRV